jgi:D-alanyl-D-alanine carboxypeptidase/D-alanyl-D-alanine-endopeptidase (penicillin-binding protein 4)
VVRRGRRYGLPLAAFLIAVLLTATLLVADHLRRTRTDSRAGGQAPANASGTAALAALTGGAAPTASGVRLAIDALVHAPQLAPSVVGAVTDVETGATSYAVNPATTVPPASTAKLVTAAAALTYIGPDTVFTTKTVLANVGTTTPTVVFVGAGDPTLAGPRASLLPYPAVAHLSDLVRATVTSLNARHIHDVRVVVDDRLFSGPRTGTAWKPNYLTDGDVSPVTALSVDAGRLLPDNKESTPDDRAADPPLTAGRDLVALLSRAGVHVLGSVARGVAPAGAPTLGAVSSPTVAALVARMLQHSDNDVAEALFRHIAIARHQPGTFVGGAVAVRQWLATLGVDIRAAQLVDGSGLSLRDRLSPIVLTAVLRAVADPAQTSLRPMIEGLPVAGFTGTLAARYRVPPRKVLPDVGAGSVRAKTGTLTGVSALAGYVTDADGRLLAFAFIANAVPVGGLTAAQAALDRIAGRLSTCGCH